MVQKDLFHDLVVELAYVLRFVLLALLFFEEVERLFEVVALYRDAFLNGLSKGSDALEILLIAVHDVFESRFCFLQVFAQTNIGLFLG